MDALRAMAGIIRYLTERMKCCFLEGLPTATFDLFIVFRGLAPLYRRKEFPSYSWTGWRGTLEVTDLGGNDFLRYDTWIVWYKWSFKGVINLVWDPLANDEFPLSDFEYIGYQSGRAFKPISPLPFPTSCT
jgi:hypothetical protein